MINAMIIALIEVLTDRVLEPLRTQRRRRRAGLS